MAARNEVHTVHNKKDKTWYNIVGGKTIKLDFATKKEAVEAGKELARINKAEHFIHKMNGEIGSRNSYGGDSPKRPG